MRQGEFRGFAAVRQFGSAPHLMIINVNFSDMRRVFVFCFSIFVALTSVSCRQDILDPGDGGLVPETGADVEYVNVPVSFEDFGAFEAETKGQALAGADNATLGGALFLIFRSDSRQLDSYQFFTPSQLSSGGLQVRCPLTSCDVYVLGNLLAVKRSDSNVTANLVDAFGGDFPVSETDLEAFIYRLDGGNINGTWRRETMDEVRKYGVPFSVCEKNVNMRNIKNNNKSIPQTNPTWMFSKVVVTVDHTAFDGGVAGNVNYFVNNSMYMRQANLKLLPFSSTPVKAQELSDVGTGDYDPSMTNGNANQYIFFVPENVQGTASGVSDSMSKNHDNTSIPDAIRSYGTYVEFNGTLSQAAGGFGGIVKYQFYLGANATTDFNLQRGRVYNVTLSFTAANLFNGAQWKVTPNLTDNRLFALTADAANTTDIGNVNAQRMLAVRVSRPGAFYAYMNPSNQMGSTNLLIGKSSAMSMNYEVSSISDCAWYGAFMKSGTEDANWLADRGITPTWDTASGKLSFSVTDATKFNSHIGESRSFSMVLLPGGTLSSTFKIQLFTDMNAVIADSKSLTDEFYLGQKRTVSISGFSGSSVKYAAVQEKCGSSSSSAKNSNVQWKTSNNSSAAFPTCAVDAAGNVLLDPSSSVYNNQGFSGSLDIYAFYPNRFLSKHSGWSSKNGKIVFFSDDWLNDSYEVDIRISEPGLHLWRPEGEETPYNSVLSGSKVPSGSEFAPWLLGVDGSLRSGSESYFTTFSGSGVVPVSSFDETLYNNLLKFSSSFTPKSSELSWVSDCLSFQTLDDGKVEFCLSKLKSGSNSILSLSFDKYTSGYSSAVKTVEGQSTLGTFSFIGNPTTGLFTESTSSFYIAVNRPVIKSWDITTSYEDYDSAHHTTLEDMYAHTFVSDAYTGVNEKCIEWSYLDFIVRESDNTIVPAKPLTIEFSITGINQNVFDNLNVVHEQDAFLSNYCQASDGTLIYPYFRTQFSRKSSAPNSGTYVWEWDPNSQVISHSGESIPGSLLYPAGPQSFSLKVTNIWEGVAYTCSEESIRIVHRLSYSPIVVMNDTPSGTGKGLDNRVYFAPDRAAQLLSEMGQYMTPQNRRFCIGPAAIGYLPDYFYAIKEWGDRGPGTSEYPIAIDHANANGYLPPDYRPGNTVPLCKVNGRVFPDAAFVTNTYFQLTYHEFIPRLFLTSAVSGSESWRHNFPGGQHGVSPYMTNVENKTTDQAESQKFTDDYFVTFYRGIIKNLGGVGYSDSGYHGYTGIQMNDSSISFSGFYKVGRGFLDLTDTGQTMFGYVN